MTAIPQAIKAVRALREGGPSALAERAVRAASRRLALGARLDLLPADVADSATLTRPRTPPPRPPGTPLRIGFVLSPPAPNSGGHATLFRFVEALERAGHECSLHLYDPYGSTAAEYEPHIRERWPRVRAAVRTAADGLPDLDVWVATAWETAHVLARRSDVAGHRVYLAQDFEPWFYPRGSAYALAEDSYRFGFHTITVGHMVADELRTRFGVDATVAEFGCDSAVYRTEDHGARGDVVLYGRPSTERRGYELAVLGLERFHELRPEVTIHAFGTSGARRLPFPATVHTHTPPAVLNQLYQRCSAGLALSFTNISLIAYELLAAGVVPVVNDWRGSRADLVNPFVEWARPTPDGIAQGLARACDRRATSSGAEISASVAEVSWAGAESTVVDAIRRICLDGRPADTEGGSDEPR